MQRSGIERAMSTGAYWKLLQRIAVIAGCVDLVYLCAFWAIGMPVTALLNLVSAASYAVAYQLLAMRRNRWAVTIMWTEVIVHASACTVLLGWNTGVHYFLMVFLPAVATARSTRNAVLSAGFILAIYLGLDAVSTVVAPAYPLSGQAALALRWLNITIVFMMFGYTGYYHVHCVRDAERRLSLLATTDAMTGLLNRRHFLEMASREMSKADRSGAPMTVALVDIDLFKRVNDEHGHATGDKVICHVSTLLACEMRDGDLLGRWGGEEFILLLPGTGVDGASQLCERLRDRVECTPVEVGPLRIPVTVSIGVSGVDIRAPLDDSIQGADCALYGAKAEGRNRICLRADLRSSDTAQPGGHAEVPPKMWRR
jgi:diguanylate cyclase (GGDEF)-like protein